MRVSKQRVSKSRFISYGRCAERLKPFLLIFKLCGIFANVITEGRLKRCSWPFYGIGVFWVSLYISYMCILLDMFVRLDHIPITVAVDFVKHFAGYMSLSYNVVIAYTSQDLFGKFFDLLDNYDHEAARMKHRRRDSLWIPWVLALSITVVILWLVSAMMLKASMDIKFLVTFSDICTIITHMSGMLEKFTMLYLLLLRFKHLNNKIAPKVSWDTKQCGPKTIDIADVKIMHLILYDAHQAFSDIYSNQLLLCFTSFMMHILGNIRTFREKSLLLSCAFICTPVMQILILCAICHYTAEEANKIACVLIENMITLVPSGHTTAKISVLTYLLHKRVSFDAAGFFIINLPLFQSIIAAIATYFIILI